MDRHRTENKERIENVHCSDAEAAVAKHFEESLRRAKLLPYANRNTYQIGQQVAASGGGGVAPTVPSVETNSQNRQFYNFAPYSSNKVVLPMPPKLVNCDPLTAGGGGGAIHQPKPIPVQQHTQPSVIVSVSKPHLQQQPQQHLQPQPQQRYMNSTTSLPTQYPTVYTIKSHPPALKPQPPQLQQPQPRKVVPMPPSTVTIHYSQPTPGSNLGLNQSKPKISAPAPSHIYGKPSGSRPLLLPQTPQPQPPPPEQVIRYVKLSANPIPQQHPPPAHYARSMYEPQPQLYYPPNKATPTPPPPPPLTSNPSLTISPSNQTQPLNLGVKREVNVPIPGEAKKIRFGSPKPMPLLPNVSIVSSSSSSSASSSPIPLALTKVHREIMEGCITIQRSEIIPTVTIERSRPTQPPPPSLQTNRMVMPPLQQQQHQPQQLSGGNMVFKVKEEPSPTSQHIIFNVRDELGETIPQHMIFKVKEEPTSGTGQQRPPSADLSPPTQNNILKVLARFAEAERVGNSDSLPRNLKKAWLQRHTVSAEGNQTSTTVATTPTTTTTTTTPPPPVKPVVKQKPTVRKKPKTVYQEASSDEDSCSDMDTATEDDSADDSSDGGDSRDSKDSVKRQTAASTQQQPFRHRYPHVTVRRSKAEKEEIMRLKKSGQSFLQNKPCFEAAPKIYKCRECRRQAYRQTKHVMNIFCRFYAFRRLKYMENGELAFAGFSEPKIDSTPEDLGLWMTDPENPTKDLDIRTSLFLLNQVGDQFCDLWQQENQAVLEHMADDKDVAWKKVVKGVREMCDVCATTIFNYHWTCERCGFAVCIDCYKDRKRGSQKVWGKVRKNRDDFSWLYCSKKIPHEQGALRLTRIVAGQALQIMGERMHQVRQIWQIPMMCNCGCNSGVNDVKPEYIDLARELVLEEYKSNAPEGSFDQMQAKDKTMKALEVSEPLYRKHIAEYQARKSSQTDRSMADEFLDNLVMPHQIVDIDTESRVMTQALSSDMYPKACSSWLCEGRLLRLPDPKHAENLLIFQEQWKRALPIVVSDVTKCLNVDLWRPEAFCRDFGNQRNDLVNCLNGNLVPNRPMRDFWDGFQSIGKRLVDSKGVPMLLKLKDWPPGEDFAEILPERYNDLMKALPLSEYTHRTGRLNLASRLPEAFVRPDLGPKMYNAYGSALYPDRGTTNLHLDISDAVNVMVYVGIPEDDKREEYVKEAYRAIDEADCDILMRRRVREKHELPGAIWHIYSPRDSNKIRDLLNRVTIERGEPITVGSDPIHDQNHYLDKKLRERLYREYGVQGYAIAQCLGDAIFIPAGAPHQVRNLHNCIKVAEDFVSPENIKQCFDLTHEFRQLSDTHSNHEDKLQIKNIIFHAVKDATTVLIAALNRRVADKPDLKPILINDQ